MVHDIFVIVLTTRFKRRRNLHPHMDVMNTMLLIVIIDLKLLYADLSLSMIILIICEVIM